MSSLQLTEARDRVRSFGRGSRVEADAASEAACLVGDVTATIVGQPLDGDRKAIDQPEASCSSPSATVSCYSRSWRSAAMRTASRCSISRRTKKTASWRRRPSLSPPASPRSPPTGGGRDRSKSQCHSRPNRRPSPPAPQPRPAVTIRAPAAPAKSSKSAAAKPHKQDTAVQGPPDAYVRLRALRVPNGRIPAPACSRRSC